MADSKIIFIRTDTQTQVPIRAVDNGDGTFSLAVATGVDGAIIAVGGRAGKKQVEFTAIGGSYPANERVSESASNTGTVPLLALFTARTVGGSGFVTGCRLVMNKTGLTTRWRVYMLTKAQPPTVIVGDNGAYDSVFANRAYRVSSFELPPMTTTGSDQSSAQRTDFREPFKCEADDDDIYFALVPLDAVTLDAGQTVFIETMTDLD